VCLGPRLLSILALAWGSPVRLQALLGQERTLRSPDLTAVLRFHNLVLTDSSRTFPSMCAAPRWRVVGSEAVSVPHQNHMNPDYAVGRRMSHTLAPDDANRTTSANHRDRADAAVALLRSVVGGLLLSMATASPLLAQGTPRNWRSTAMTDISYAEGYGSTCGSSGTNGRYHYHEFKNTGANSVSFVVTFDYTDERGETRKTDYAHTLAPGRTTGWGGSWRCVREGTVRMTIGAAPVRRSANGVRLDAECKRILRAHDDRLRAAGAAQMILAWTPLLKVLSGSAPEGVLTVATEDWEDLGRGIVNVGRLVRSSLATEALIHADTHTDEATKRFWKRLSDTYVGAR
jgi:hypothetical protein